MLAVNERFVYSVIMVEHIEDDAFLLTLQLPAAPSKQGDYSPVLHGFFGEWKKEKE